MLYSFRPQGVCAREMQVELDEQGVIRELDVMGGCSGNLQGLAALLKGMDVEDAIRRMEGIRCGFKSTSCPDQLAKALRKVVENG